jgi:predicted DNA-binding transcriptional regulator YafY
MRTRQRRLLRDVEELGRAGVRIERINSPGFQIAYVIQRGDSLLPQLDLTPDQRSLLARIAYGFQHSGAVARHLDTAWLKLQAGAGADGLPAGHEGSAPRRALPRGEKERRCMEAVRGALLERRRISFRYRPYHGRPQSRTVRPYGLVSRRGGTYLLAFDEDRGAVRTFRLARVVSAVIPAGRGAGPDYHIPADFDPETVFSADVFGRGRDAYRDVQVHFDADVAFVVRNDFEGIYPLKDQRDGSVVLEIEQAYPGELLRYLGEFPGRWRVLSPEPLRRLIVQRLQGALKAAGGSRP